MNIYFNSFFNVPLINENFNLKLTDQQKKVIAVASIAFGFFTICWVMVHCFRGNIKEGTGKDSFLFGSITREGNFENYKLNGQGKKTHHFYKLTTLEGEFKDDRLCGIGKITDENAIYEGECVNDKPHGFGKATLPTGEVYEGEFINGQLEGPGSISFKGVTIEIKNFKNNKPMNGSVTVTMPDGSLLGARVKNGQCDSSRVSMVYNKQPHLLYPSVIDEVFGTYGKNPVFQETTLMDRVYNHVTYGTPLRLY